MRSRILAALVALGSGCAAMGGTTVPESPTPPGMVRIPRGRFTMGTDKGELNERPAHKVRLSGYALDRTEVSALEFAEFLNALGNPNELYFTPDERATVVFLPGAERGASQRLYAPRPGYEDYPANNVSWLGAQAYCEWKGRRLPTEAEWEKGARGTDKRRYPWGKEPPAAAKARFAQSWPEHQFQVLAPVDTLAAGESPYGLLNMSGNVLEWVNDWYRQNLCDFCNEEAEPDLPIVRELTGTAPEDTALPERRAPPREDPRGPAAGSFRVLRGGSWQSEDADELTTTRRFWLSPDQRFPYTGFRCAR